MQTLISAADDPARIDARGRHASWTITWWQRSIHQDILRQYRGRYRKQEHEHLADLRQIPVRRGVGVTVRPLCKSSMIDWLIDCLVDSVLFENISSIKGRLRNRWTKGCNIKAYFGLFFTILSRTSSMMPSDSSGFNILILVTNDNVCLVSESNSLLLFLLWNSGPGNEREPADNGAPGQTAGVPARHVAEPLLLWRSGDHQGLSVHR